MMNSVLSSAEFVVTRAQSVHINHERLLDYAREFRGGNTPHWLSVAPFDFSPMSEEDRLHSVVLFDALSFSYWGEPKWTVEYKGKTHDGAYGMILALGRGIEEGAPLLDYATCSRISKEDFAYVLRGNVEIPLLEERWNILRELGTTMCTKFGGRAMNLLAEAGGDTQKLLQLTVEYFPSFRDVSPYQGREVAFCKRAQLLIADIYQVFCGQGFGSMSNIHTLTACADYKLPQLLRKLGILEYTRDLAEKVDNKVELPHHSPEEVEIRASTIWAVDCIAREARRQQPSLMPCEVNDHLWLATQEKFSGDKPYHRTRTTAY